MLKLVLVASVAAHLACGVVLWQTYQNYDALLTWACAHGNGGHECGEE